MNTVFGSRTFRDDFDLKPLSSTNSSNLPMLMLMDSAQSSAIDSLHRQLAEERERATRRIQTETLMATILDERTSTSKKLDEVSTNFSAQFQSAQEEHRKLTETQQSAVENAQRRFNMERRLNETLKKAKEECESKQLSTEKTLGGEIQRITILLEAEKAAHGSDLKYSKEELARERELHDKIKLEREAQTSSLLTELKRAFEAEQKTMDEKLSAAEAGYASNVKLFEQQVSAIVTQTEAAKTQNEAAFQRQRKIHHEELEACENLSKKLKRSIFQQKCCAIFKNNANEKRFATLKRNCDESVALEQESKRFETEKIKQQFATDTDGMKLKLEEIHGIHEQQLLKLHESATLLNQKHCDELLKITTDSKAEYVSELNNLTEQFQVKLVGTVTTMNKEKEKALVQQQSDLELKWKEDELSIFKKHDESIAFFEGKVETLNNNLTNTKTQLATSIQAATSQSQKHDALKNKSETSLAEAKLENRESKIKIESLNKKFTISKDLNEQVNKNLAESLSKEKEHTRRITSLEASLSDNKKQLGGTRVELDSSNKALVAMGKKLDDDDAMIAHEVENEQKLAVALKAAEEEKQILQAAHLFKESKLGDKVVAMQAELDSSNKALVAMGKKLDGDRTMIDYEVENEQQMLAAALKSKIKEEKGAEELAAALKESNKIKERLAAAEKTMAEKLQTSNKALEAMGKRLEASQAAQEREELAESMSLSVPEIKILVDYIDNRLGNADGSLSRIEFEHVLRYSKRAKGASEEFAKGRSLCRNIEKLLQKNNFSVDEFFAHARSENKGKLGGELSLTAVHHSLATLKIENFLSESDLDFIVHYLDPHFTSFITAEEFKDCLKRGNMSTKDLVMENKCSIIMGKFEKVMHKRKLRVIDLFRRLDLDANGSLSLKEFTAGVHKFIGLSLADEDLGGVARGVYSRDKHKHAEENNGDHEKIEHLDTVL